MHRVILRRIKHFEKGWDIRVLGYKRIILFFRGWTNTQRNTW